jgi:hypothetical protein
MIEGAGRKLRSPCPPGEVRDRRTSNCRRDKRMRYSTSRSPKSPSKKEKYQLYQLKKKIKHLKMLQKKYKFLGAEKADLEKAIHGRINWHLEDPVDDGDESVIVRAQKDLDKAAKSIQKYIREHKSNQKMQNYIEETFYQ